MLFLFGPLRSPSKALAQNIPRNCPRISSPTTLLYWASSVGNNLTQFASQTNHALAPTLVSTAANDANDNDGDPDDQPALDPTPAHVALLARIIEAEAGNQPFQGQVAVGAVVVNRVLHHYASTLEGVIFAPGQFEPISNGRFYLCQPSAASLAAAREALSGIDPTNGALYFYNPSLTNDHFIRSLPILTQIGAQVFAA